MTRIARLDASIRLACDAADCTAKATVRADFRAPVGEGSVYACGAHDVEALAAEWLAADAVLNG